MYSLLPSLASCLFSHILQLCMKCTLDCFLTAVVLHDSIFLNLYFGIPSFLYSYSWQSDVFWIICMPPCLLHRMQCFASRFFSVGMPSANTTALHLSELLGFTLTFYRAIPSHCKSYPWCIQVLLKSSEHLGRQFSSLFLLFLPCARTHTCKTEHPRLIPSNGPAFLVSLVVGKWLLYSWTTRAK